MRLRQRQFSPCHQRDLRVDFRRGPLGPKGVLVLWGVQGAAGQGPGVGACRSCRCPPGSQEQPGSFHDFFGVGTGRPAIFKLTAPRVFRVVKYKVFQSSPPNAMLVVSGYP